MQNKILQLFSYQRNVTLSRTAENNSDRERRNTFQRERQKDSKTEDNLFQFTASGIKPQIPANPVSRPAGARGAGGFPRAHTDTGKLLIYILMQTFWPS